MSIERATAAIAARAPAEARLLAAAAVYGFSVGSVRSFRYASLNLIKLPLLIAISGCVCAAAYTLWARLVAPRLAPSDVRRLVVESYADLATLLASISPVCLFLALTLRAPVSAADLGEYPLFLGLNVAAIAACGSLAVGRQAALLLRRHALSRGRALAVVAGWLAISLLVGGQAAWYLRPFFGNRALPESRSFCLGSRPDYRGATSFYDAVYHLVAPPPHGE